MERNGLVRRAKKVGKDKDYVEVNGNIPVKKQLKLKRKQQKLIFVALSSLRYVVECLFCNFLLMWFLILVLPIAVLNLVLKKVEQFIVCLKVKAVPLRGEDAIWLQDSDTNRLIITSVIIVDKQVDENTAIKDFRQIVYERMVTYKNSDGSIKFPRAKQFIQPGLFQYFLVEDSNFDIDKHVFKFDGELPKSKEELEGIISKMCCEPLRKDRPPWYFCYIANKFDDTAAVVFRIHHCIADGVSLSRFMTRILTDEHKAQKEARKFSSYARGFMYLKALFVTARVVISLLLSFPDKSIIHGKSLIGKKNCVWSQPLDLDLIKRVKTTTGTTINDVLVASLTMAMRKYFQKKGVKNPEDFTASVPVDVSSSTETIEFQNKFSVVFIKLPSSQESALDILSETKARIDAVKFSGEPFAMAWSMNLSVELLPEILVKPLISFISIKSTCVMSNVPGPQHSLSVSGHPIKYMTFWPPQRNNIGVGISIFSYAGQVVIGAQGDLEVMNDPEAVTELFDESIHELAAVVLGGEKHNNPSLTSL
ncbi:uncharacterized protein LOC116302815 [Actinia tenebrosa]|uniref:Uncharacterized protein LOC116302815 n=1 Tax=Actinia tenebrosa TaxID=6105 RepID=A0A6P8INH1_ACTTE|nr:uncharacterized protein LOC116302815 [Actinia tenebrosa]